MNRMNEEFAYRSEREREVFEYLDELQESGVTNMFGAGSYLEREFDFSRYEAKSLLVEWMQTYSKRH